MIEYLGRRGSLDGDEPAVARRSKSLGKKAKVIVNDAEAARALLLGIHGLTAMAMQGVADLDEDRRYLAKGDPVLNTILAPFEGGAANLSMQVIKTYARDSLER